MAFTAMTKDEAKKLQQQVNAILRRAYRNDKLKDAAVNWSDPKCNDIVECRSAVEDYKYVVIAIDEASPSASELQRFVEDELKKAGFVETYGVMPICETEW